MHFRRPVNLLLASVVAVSCNTRLHRADSAPSSSAPVPNQSSLLAAPSVTPSNGAERLPPLKPVIGKPFPEGASQDVVCEAIHSKETDLWARFGHLVPLYMRGAIFVLEAGQSRQEAITHFVTKEYVHPHFPQLASCGERTLLYVSSLAENAEFGGKPFGRVHLSHELERRLGIKTTESFEIVEDRTRLGRYCGLSGDECDALRKLNVTNEGLGLCADVERFCFRRLELEPGARAEIEKTCLKVPTSTLACLEYSPVGSELRSCKSRLEDLICP